MYLIATVFNIARDRGNVYLSGNLPEDLALRTLMVNSGFDHFVSLRGQTISPPKHESDTIKITSGRSVNTEKAQQIIKYLIAKTGKNKNCFSFLYNMLIELMSNANEHAYPSSIESPLSAWYSYVKFEPHSANFIFLDTGCGIPSTVRKKFSEKINPFLSESSILCSALDGEFRTQTKLSYRGKGLPGIMERQVNGQIQNLLIISGRAKISNAGKDRNAEDTRARLTGTLYFWTIAL